MTPEEIFNKLEADQIDIEESLELLRDFASTDTTLNTRANRAQAPLPAGATKTAPFKVSLAPLEQTSIRKKPACLSNVAQKSVPVSAVPRKQPATEVVKLKVIDGVIAVIRMEEREAKNMFTPRLVRGLVDAFERIETAPSLKVAVITGFDNWFCCGGTEDQLDSIRQGEASFMDHPFFRILLDCSLPTIAVMQGHALGGGLTFGLYADVVFAAEHAYYAASFMEHGFTPGVGATLLFPKKMGPTLANEMLFSAKRYKGIDLKARGASLRVESKEKIFEAAMELAANIASKPKKQLRLLKRRMTQEISEALPDVLAEELSMHEQSFEGDNDKTMRDSSYFEQTSPRLVATNRAGNAHTELKNVVLNKFQEKRVITLNRADKRNALNEQMLRELHHCLDIAEQDAENRIVIIRGQPTFFCTGLDFSEYVTQSRDRDTTASGWPFMQLLKRFSSTSRIIIAEVDGDVIGGGVGLVAASDFVHATRRSKYQLPEVLFGLFPAMVMPYLIRRLGYQKSVAMGLGTLPIEALSAKEWGLIDELYDDWENLEQGTTRKIHRFKRMDPQTIRGFKTYSKGLWFPEKKLGRRAVREIDRLLSSPTVLKNIEGFLSDGQFTSK